MKITIVVDIPKIKNPNSYKADLTINALTQDLEAGLEDWDWYINDAVGGK